MAQIFTANQVNHVYVVNDLLSVKPVKSDDKGDTYVGGVKDDANGSVKSIYFAQRGAAGLVRSDLIDIDKIMYVKYTPAAKMARKKNAAMIQINASALNNTAPYVGQDYILRLTFQNPVGMSPDHVYNKHAVVHAVSGMSASDFYAKMAQSLVMNLSREAVKLLHVYLTVSGSSDVEVTSANQTLSGSYTGLKLVEAEQEWILGVKQDKPIIFKINGSTINNGVEDVVWEDVTYSNGYAEAGGAVPEAGIIKENTSTSPHTWNIKGTTIVVPAAPDGGTVKNGHLAAELEYFSMGERADLYRQVGWPDCRITEYLVDPTKEYDMIGLHYFYIGSNHAIQKSEKDITLLIPRAGTDTTASSLGALATSVKEAIEALMNDEVKSQFINTLFPNVEASDNDASAKLVVEADVDDNVTGVTIEAGS